MPQLAKQADKYSIIRSMTHGDNGHETAAYKVQTGRNPGDGQVYPNVGAGVSLFKGYDAGYQGLIPPYIVLTTPQGRFSEAGFLGSRYKPFATGGDPARTPFVVEGVVAQGISEKRQMARRDLLGQLNTLGAVLKNNPELTALSQAEKQAYDLILGDAGKVFDCSDEDDALRDRYGRNTFGQSCLVARRLIERGVPYVTINYRGWDTHKAHFTTMRQKLPEMDKGMATLLQDLTDRGLLDSTIVWWSGEFGRTPKVQWEAPWNGGKVCVVVVRRLAARSSAPPTQPAKKSRTDPSTPSTSSAAYMNSWASIPTRHSRTRRAWRSRSCRTATALPPAVDSEKSCNAWRTP